MRFVTDEDIDLVRVCFSVTVEVTELNASSTADDPSQRLCERLGPGRVVSVPTFSQQCRHQVDGEHRLARTRAATNQNDSLPSVVETCSVAGENPLEDDELLVEHDVCGVPLAHRRDVIHELLARAVPALLDP